jgi:hypothetical protein
MGADAKNRRNPRDKFGRRDITYWIKEKQMTQATDTDIRDIKDLIVGLDSKITTIAKDVVDLKIATAELKVSLAGLDTRLTNIENRSNLQVNWFLGIITALVGVLSTILVKTTFYP